MSDGFHLKSRDSHANMVAADSANAAEKSAITLTVPTEEGQDTSVCTSDVVYKVEDVPPWYLSMVLGLQFHQQHFIRKRQYDNQLLLYTCSSSYGGLQGGHLFKNLRIIAKDEQQQSVFACTVHSLSGTTMMKKWNDHYLTMFSGAVAIPYLISSELCISEHDPARGYIINTTLFVAGIASLLQATFGNRLPIVQGPSLSFLVPTLAILSLPQWQCPSDERMANLTQKESDEVWMARMREVQGAIVVASVIEVLVGLTGLIGLMMRWITPLAIAPTITLIGLSLFLEAAKKASDHWGIAIMTMILLTVFSQYLSNVNTPRCSYSKDKGCHLQWFPFFKLFPVMLTVLFSWGVCAVLTSTSVLPEDSRARTDHALDALEKAKWFRVPYPGQWGMPTINVGPVLGVVAGVLASIIESVGDYYACARLAGAPPPPVHAINRGIFMEGIGCVIAGFSGTGSGLTSFSQNIAAIGITKVGSRRVVQYASVIISLFGLIGKFGALFIMIPSPIMGGIFCVMFAIITGVGLSNLQFINLNSSRNLFILGFSIFMGLCIPTWLNEHPSAIDTGNLFADQILSILLRTSMFVGGVLGCLLDNTIPGSKEERGIIKWQEETNSGSYTSSSVSDCYDLPFGMKFIRKLKCLTCLPISPTYDSDVILRKFKNMTECCASKKKENTYELPTL